MPRGDGTGPWGTGPLGGGRGGCRNKKDFGNFRNTSYETNTQNTPSGLEEKAARLEKQAAALRNLAKQNRTPE
jgi:hypothetical protein